jgi:hypothetical protein
MQFSFDSWGGMLSPVDYQKNSLGNTSIDYRALADQYSVIVLEKDVGLPK